MKENEIIAGFQAQPSALTKSFDVLKISEFFEMQMFVYELLIKHEIKMN